MTNQLTIADVEQLKSAGRFVHAGALQAALGYGSAYYGCHFGMRSTLDGAKAAFADGFRWAETEMLANELEDSTPSSTYVASAYSYDRD